jgi:hypothetical protein
METRINSWGNKEVKLQPNGLPAIWVEMYCDRCREYQECLGFKAISKREWEIVNDAIYVINSFPILKRELEKYCTHAERVRLHCNSF